MILFRARLLDHFNTFQTVGCNTLAMPARCRTSATIVSIPNRAAIQQRRPEHGHSCPSQAPASLPGTLHVCICTPKSSLEILPVTCWRIQLQLQGTLPREHSRLVTHASLTSDAMLAPRTIGCRACGTVLILLCLCRLRRHWWHLLRNCLLTTVRKHAHLSQSYGFTCQRLPDTRPPLSTSTSISLGLTSTARSALPSPPTTCPTRIHDLLLCHRGCTQVQRCAFNRVNRTNC